MSNRVIAIGLGILSVAGLLVAPVSAAPRRPRPRTSPQTHLTRSAARAHLGTKVHVYRSRAAGGQRTVVTSKHPPTVYSSGRRPGESSGEQLKRLQKEADQMAKDAEAPVRGLDQKR